MKRYVLLGFAVGMAVAAIPAFAVGERTLDVSQSVRTLNGSPTFLGTIATHDAGTSNNWTTPLPDAGATGAFDAGFGSLLLLQCDQPTWLANGSSATLSTANGVKVDTDEKYYTMLKSNHSAVAIRPVSGASAYCDVYRME